MVVSPCLILRIPSPAPVIESYRYLLQLVFIMFVAARSIEEVIAVAAAQEEIEE